MTLSEHSSEVVSLHRETQIGLVALAVADLERSVAFYTDVIGFRELGRPTSESAMLGVGSTPYLVLKQQEGALPRPAYSTGLYHFAILVPSRVELGYSLLRLTETQYPVDGASDHGVSEALYLSDPDGNGIEMYRDRSRSEWAMAGSEVRMGSTRFDIEEVIAEAQRQPRAWQGLAEQTYIGHMHLQVGDLRQAEAFYHGIFGFDIMQQMPGALFVSAGGYHHHIGLNTWNTRGAPQAPENAVGLRFFSVTLPDEAELARVSAQLRQHQIKVREQNGVAIVADPWQNKIVLTVGKLTKSQDILALF